MVAGTLFSAYSQNQQGKYQEDLAKNNAIVQQRQADDAIKRGEVDEMNHRLKVAQMKSSQRAKFGASGADVNSGSSLDVLADTAMMGELDALTIRGNASREAYGYRVGASNTIAQGKLDKSRGTNNAISTLLTGGGKVSSQWYSSR